MRCDGWHGRITLRRRKTSGSSKTNQVTNLVRLIPRPKRGPPLIAAALFAALAVFALFWHLDPQLRGDRNQAATIAMFALAYCYGALALADVVFDRSSGRETQTVVLEKRIHVSGGVKGSSAWYQVKVDPEASPAGANWINVEPDLWGSFHRGDTVCVHLGDGLLAVRWYAVVPCAD